MGCRVGGGLDRSPEGALLDAWLKVVKRETKQPAVIRVCGVFVPFLPEPPFMPLYWRNWPL